MGGGGGVVLWIWEECSNPGYIYTHMHALGKELMKVKQVYVALFFCQPAGDVGSAGCRSVEARPGARLSLAEEGRGHPTRLPVSVSQ